MDKLIFVDAIIAASEKAVLLEIEGEEFWCPRSLIVDGDELENENSVEADFGDRGSNCELWIKEFWCEENGLL